jgi:hypothetical protein
VAAHRVRRHADFLKDLEDQLVRLQQHRDESWIRRLREDIEEATRALTGSPPWDRP